MLRKIAKRVNTELNNNNIIGNVYLVKYSHSERVLNFCALKKTT